MSREFRLRKMTISVGFRDHGINGKENGNHYMVHRGYIGIMEKKIETT